MAERRSNLPMLLTVALLFAAAWGATWIGDPATLPVRAVRFDGDLVRVDRAELQRNLAPVATTSLLLVDVARLRETVEAVAWVDRAYVRRVWPDTVMVTVIEQAPLARWDATRLVNGRGELFTAAADDLPADLPTLHGPEGQAAVIVDQYRLLDSLLQRVGARVARLELNARRAWSLQLDNGMQIELGRQQVRERLQRLVGLLDRFGPEQLARVERVDLRYTNGYAVRWRSAPADGTAALGGRPGSRTEEGNT